MNSKLYPYVQIDVYFVTGSRHSTFIVHGSLSLDFCYTCTLVIVHCLTPNSVFEKSEVLDERYRF